MTIQDAIAKAVEKENLSLDEMKSVMEILMTGTATPAQIGSFLTALRMKGETVEEITAAAMVMREKAIPINACLPRSSEINAHGIPALDETILDTCGTGGDQRNTFNISTATAFVAAGAGVKVAKHGNRAASSACGSADVWEALGISLSISPSRIEECISEVGIGFLFAPALHAAMKYAIGPRKEIGIRTFFNLLGPLTNPAGARVQLLGVYRKELTGIMAGVLGKLGCRRAMVVHGADGLDEISISGPTYVSELNRGRVLHYHIDPADYSISRRAHHDLRGGTPEENAHIILEILKGRKGPSRDIVILNAAAALYVAEVVPTIGQGVTLASTVIDQGKALEKLNALIQWTNASA